VLAKGEFTVVAPFLFSALSASSAFSGFDFLLVFSALISVPPCLRGEPRLYHTVNSTPAPITQPMVFAADPWLTETSTYPELPAIANSSPGPHSV